MELPPYLKRLRETFPDAVEEIDCPQDHWSVSVKRDEITDILTFLKEDEEACFDHFMDLTAVDYLGRRPRFEVVIHLLSIPKLQRVRVKVPLEEDDPVMPSVTSVYPAANWFERECWDLYGIQFQGHPNLKRILLYDEFQGHPLRKDYPIRLRQPRIPLRKPEVSRSDQALEPERRDASLQK